MIGKRVLDLNAGLGGRVYALDKSGFEIVGVIDNDVENCEILASWIDSSKIIYRNLLELDPSSLPEADLIIAKYLQRSFSENGKKSANNNVNIAIYNIVEKKNPCIFLLEVPVSSITYRREELDEYMQMFSDLGYVISYQVYDEMSFSGYPMIGKQGYIVGERIFDDKRFEFPEPVYLNSVRSVIFENALDVDDWYRKVKIPIDVCERDTWYIKIYDDVKKTNNIHMGSMRENYLMDGIGPRKFTHNECALFKGLDNWDYNRCKNKKRMYNKIAYASNVFVVRAISDKLIAYISDDNNQKAEKIEQKKEKCEAQKKSKRKADKIIFPKCTLSEIKIIKLKGINNLVLKFEKNLVALMGVNGSGKSTILHALACTYSPYQKGESYQFSYFFTPNPDATWKDSCFTVINHDVNEGKDIFKTYEKRGNRWARYSTRPVRDVFYMGVSSCIPEIEIEKKTSFINYVSSSEKDKLAEKIIEDAAYILNKDYEELMSHTTGKKKYIGVQTKKGIVYSALSMGAGEQRVIKLLQTVYNAHQYSLILIDEIDLLLHVDAFKKLIIRLSEIATDRNLQIIFTTHSLEINELNKYTDIRYMEHQDSKILVYDTIKPDLLYELSGERIHPYSIYVEDKFAAAIVREVAKDLNMQRHINIITFGSIENAFTVAAGKVLGKENINNILIVTDGDELVTIEDKTKRLNAILTGTESDHEEKVNKALSMITQFDLPVGMKPEKFVHSMLIRMDKDDECIVCARNIASVKESHDWIGKIEIQMGIGDLIYDHIMNIVSENECWWKYVNNIREWLKQKREEVRLISLDEQCVEQNL